MGDEVNRLAGKLGLDTTDFKTALAGANRELRVLESGFRAGTAALGDWSNNATGLEARVKSLTGQIDIQKAKVAALREEQARLANEQGATSIAAQKAQIKLNEETETLGKMQNELSGTTTALGNMSSEEKETGDKAEEAGSKLEKFKGIMAGIGKDRKSVV